MPSALPQSRVLKIPGAAKGVLRTANAFGALAEPGVENIRQRNGRPTDGKRLRRSCVWKTLAFSCRMFPVPGRAAEFIKS